MPSYDWKRFWCTRGGLFRLDTHGFLADPEAEYSQYYSNNALPFEQINQHPCLVLLGEPGQGKSSTLVSEYEQVKSRGGEALFVQLKSEGDFTQIKESLFQAPEYQSWLANGHALHIFLDSFDECAIRIESLSQLLAREFATRWSNKKEHLQQLRLRLACRTADWQNSFTNLETQLISLWGENSIGVYELAPLRAKDIDLAAVTEQLDAGAFLEQVLDKQVVSLAVKPITLLFLIRQFKKGGGKFAETQRELYEEGCKLLADEIDDQRRSRRIHLIDAEKRLEVASRIAALTIFGRKKFIRINSALDEVPTEAIITTEIVGQSEVSKGNEFDVREADVMDTLSTALFSSGGEKSFVWAHQTYAEYLAARYLHKRGLSAKQILHFIINPSDVGGRVIPQLRETAAWLATLEPTMFEALLERDPETLLRSDVTVASDEGRATLVQGLLKAYEEERLMPSFHTSRDRYKYLNHSGLAKQLRAYLEDTKRNWIARDIAIDIVESNELPELEDALVQIALNPDEVYRLRSSAVYALRKVGSLEARAKLKPLALAQIGEDPDDEIKGASLNATWPDVLSIDELLVALTRRKKSNLYGTYKLFLTRSFLTEPMDAEAMRKVLTWLNEPANWGWLADDITFHYSQDTSTRLDNFLGNVIDSLDHPGMLEALAKFLHERATKHDGHSIGRLETSPFRQKLEANPQQRYEIFAYIMRHYVTDENRLASLVYLDYVPRLITQEDLGWVLEQLETEGNEIVKRRWASLVRYIARPDLHHEKLFEVYQRNTLLQQVLVRWFGPIELGSELAKQMQDEFEQEKKWAEERRKYEEDIPMLDPPPEVRIQRSLERTKSDPKEWWRLTVDLLLEPTAHQHINEYAPDLTKSFGWVNANDFVRQQIIHGAHQYLLHGEPAPDEWLGKTNIFWRPATAGFKALWLLLKESNPLFTALPVDVWKKWACVVATYPIDGTVDDARDELDKILLSLSYQVEPDGFAKAVTQQIESDLKTGDYIRGTHRLESIWDDKLTNVVSTLLDKRNYKPVTYNSLILLLLAHGSPQAHQLACSKVVKRRGKIQRDYALKSAEALVTHATDAAWDLVWPILQSDKVFGKELLLGVAGRSGKPVESRITEKAIADLYIYLEQEFPRTEDPNHDNESMAHWVSPRDEIADWRNRLLQNLKERGTRRAITALERILQTFPEQIWLKWTIHEARETLRSHSWEPLSPELILELTHKPDSRLIRSSEQLLEVVLESLERFQQKLQGETPMNIFLWNEWKDKKYRPKDEAALSDLVKLHLNSDLKGTGVILNREVEIRRPQSQGTGERTDIQVDVPVLSQGTGEEKVGVIIEVKGCWNDGWETGMQTQLADKYLKNNLGRHGIHLVGWFLCESWDEEDYRLKDTKSLKMTIDEVATHLDTRAKTLSSPTNQIQALVLDATLR